MPLCERSLEIAEKSLGPENPMVATSLHNVAALLFAQVCTSRLPADTDNRAQGKYDEAMPLYERSLKIREMTLGSDHPDVAASLNKAAELFSAQVGC